MDGYKVVDLKDISLSGTPVTIAGVYNAIISTEKVILLVNINLGGTKIPAAFAACSVSGTTITALVAGFVELTITSADAVSIAE